VLYFSFVAPAICYLFFLHVVLYVFLANKWWWWWRRRRRQWSLPSHTNLLWILDSSGRCDRSLLCSVDSKRRR